MMSEDRYAYGYEVPLNVPTQSIPVITDTLNGKQYYSLRQVVDLLNEQEQKIQRWKNLYELKDSEVTARVDTLNRVCNYYLTEIGFKSDTDPNQAVKEVINEILNAPIYEEG